MNTANRERFAYTIGNYSRVATDRKGIGRGEMLSAVLLIRNNSEKDWPVQFDAVEIGTDLSSTAMA